MKSQLFFKIKTKTNFKLHLVLIASLFFVFTNVFAQNKEFVVVLDAGHGGKDPGKTHKHFKEKDIALNIVLEVGKLLEKEKNVKVIYTRKTDVFIGLKERGKIANKADADLFVSVHCNAHNSQAYGSETWVLGTHANHKNFEVAKAENSVITLEEDFETKYNGFDPNSPESIIGLTLMQEEYLDQSIHLASIIQDGFTNVLKRKNRGVKQAGFVVLHQTYMPSVLIETGFLTNNYEGAFLYSKKGQNQFANSIYKSVLTYINQLQVNTVVVDPSIEAITKSSNESNNNENTSQEYKNVVFKVQIAAGRKLDPKPYNFKGLDGVERARENGTYKYYIGNTSNYEEIQIFQQKAKKQGFKSAFIVAFKNGVKVPVENVLIKS